jgi:predicted SnoaL-like aldol condensation-catalyzing enzyme
MKILTSSLLLAALASVSLAADLARVWIPAGAGNAATEKRNKDVVVGGWLQDPGKAHWRDFMVPEFLNHDPDEQRIGAQALVDQMTGGRASTTLAAIVPPGGLARPRFTVIADGEYVAVAHNPQGFDLDAPAPGVDPGAALGGNVFHVVNGKITEWWFYAGARAPAAGGAAAADAAGNIRRGVYGNTPLIYAPRPTDEKTEAANKQLVLAWIRDFWVDRHYAAWQRYLGAGFRNHDARFPAQGAAELVTWLGANPDFRSEYAVSRGVGRPLLFLLAEGDLVFALDSPEVNDHFDPGAQIASMTGNIFRVADGRIVESWRAGSTRTVRAKQ